MGQTVEPGMLYVTGFSFFNLGLHFLLSLHYVWDLNKVLNDGRSSSPKDQADTADCPKAHKIQVTRDPDHLVGHLTVPWLLVPETGLSQNFFFFCIWTVSHCLLHMRHTFYYNLDDNKWQTWIHILWLQDSKSINRGKDLLIQ